jgi:hypothetical protein
MKLKSLFYCIIFILSLNCSYAQVKSEYYKDSEIIFCQDVVNGNPKNASSFFIINPEGGYITVLINNGKPINTDKLILQVWKLSKSGNYDEFIETRKIDINANMESPFFKYIFYEAGKYKIIINNKNALVGIKNQNSFFESLYTSQISAFLIV